MVSHLETHKAGQSPSCRETGRGKRVSFFSGLAFSSLLWLLAKVKRREILIGATYTAVFSAEENNNGAKAWGPGIEARRTEVVLFVSGGKRTLKRSSKIGELGLSLHGP